MTFPLISAGAYGWPKDDAIRRALLAISSTSVAVAEVSLVLFSDADLELAHAIAEREGVEVSPADV